MTPNRAVKQIVPSKQVVSASHLPDTSLLPVKRLMVLENRFGRQEATADERDIQRQRSTVHVIDEGGRVHRAVNGMLWSHGYCVQCYTGIAQFLSRDISPGPACLILDLAGSSLQEVLSHKHRSISAIVLGGPNDAKKAVCAMKAGAIDFLVKPIKEGELLVAVEGGLVASERNLAIQEQLARDRATFVCLSPREQDICLRIAQGLLNKEIAFEFGISEKTVKAQRSNVMKKLNARSLPDVVRLVERLRTADAIPNISDCPPSEVNLWHLANAIGATYGA